MTEPAMDAAARRRLDAWLLAVRAGLRGLPAEEMEEIVRELTSHVLDRAAEAGSATEANISAALAALGPARDVAGLYLAERLVELTETRLSPWNVLGTAFRLAGLSIDAFFVFIGSLTLYGTGISFILCALAKPFFPDKVGFWVSGAGEDFTMSIGSRVNPIGHDIMGWWMIPFGLVAGATLTFLAWRFSLAGVRRLGRARERVFAA